MWTASPDSSPVLQNKPLSDPFLQVLSMSPKTLPSTKGMPGLQNNSAKSTTTSYAPCGLSNNSQSASQKFVPQQQTVGFGEPKKTDGSADTRQ